MIFGFFMEIINNQKIWFVTSRQPAEKMQFSIKNFFSKYDQIRTTLWIWLYLVKKSLMETLIFCVQSAVKTLPLTVFRMVGEGAKRHPTCFSSVTSTNVRISPQNFLTFNFNPLPHWCKMARPYPVPVPN